MEGNATAMQSVKAGRTVFDVQGEGSWAVLPL